MDSPVPVNRPVNRRPMNRRAALKRAGALAVAFGALEAVGPFSFAPQRIGASIVPSDIQFDISAFLAVPPQDYGTGVQFQLPPVRTVFLTATRRQNFLIPRAATAPSLTEVARPEPHHGLRPAARHAVADLRPRLHSLRAAQAVSVRSGQHRACS